jgi:hypothetical protein
MATEGEIKRWVPLILETVAEIAAFMEPLQKSLTNIAKSDAKSDDEIRRLRTQNRAAYDALAQRFTSRFHTLKIRIGNFNKAALDLSRIYSGYVEWAGGPRYSKISLDSMKDRCRGTVKVCRGILPKLDGVIESAHRSMGGQTVALDKALDMYEVILRSWAKSIASLKASAKKVADFKS